jgi:hypothetical protein
MSSHKSQDSQGPILKLIDFVDEIVEGKEKCRHNCLILATYFLFVSSVLYVWLHHSDKDFSYVLTVSGCVQTLGFFLLLHKVKVQRSVAGISSKMLQCYTLTFLFRLCSTLVKNGYLPVDRTGDWIYQAADIASLLLVFQLLFFVHKRYKTTYQQELDTFPLWKLMPGAILLGCAVHGNLNHSPFFDKIWTISLWLDTLAMLPQLWMLIAKGGEIEALTSNFVALIFMSRTMAFWFWFTGMDELAPKDGGFNTVGYLIVGAHAMQLLLSADFMYHYFMWQSEHQCTNCGQAKEKGMVLPQVLEV